ncbi:hypothetical protein DA096_19855 [Vibrio rotiferianus]|jgi:hypothetical protein|nr:hypothetical protein DA095_22965 [Vibrio rotiferianus]TMX51344.1 hypothetical protein DA093_12200 [Vibrio rotiferianus]TMX60342.1 hypothetical protein DA096_19855 [Vibrio rotiferianus]
MVGEFTTGGSAMTLLLTVLIFLCCMAMLAIGVIFSRKTMKTGCCKISDIESATKKRPKV